MGIEFVDMPVKFSSYEFYNTLLPELEEIDRESENDIVLDFSQTDRIEPLVIPNLLCLGRLIYSRYRRRAKIYIPETRNAESVKNYLNEIGFLRYAEKYSGFEFVSSPRIGMFGSSINPLCGTICFSPENTLTEINSGVRYCVNPFIESFFAGFEECVYDDDGITQYGNLMQFFLSEVLTNCHDYAKSISFTTMHARFTNRMVYVGVSDIGPGFINTIGRERACRSELEAILAGVYKQRKVKDYGLYSVILKIIKQKGKVRIHSNDTQVIFTERLLEHFIKGDLLRCQSFLDFNVKRSVYYRGVHIEIEIPMEAKSNDIF